MNNPSQGQSSPLTQALTQAQTPSQNSTAVARGVISGAGRASASAPAREAQNETDPIRRIWEALDAAGHKPQGPLHQFRAECPGHDSNSRSLSIGEGSDRRVLLHCNVGCDTRRIVEALGLRYGDLFPPGHRNATQRKPSAPKREVVAGAALLDTLRGAGFQWRAMVVLPRCPYCDNPRCLVWVHEGGGLDVDCPDGCNAIEVRRAVETRAAIAEQGVEL